MLFKRGNKLPLWRQIKRFVWPEAGFKRASKYVFYRLARLPGSAHTVAAGVASGAAVSFTPFLGLHILMAFALAWLTRGNMLAAAIGTAVGNPWTFPFIFAATGKLGQQFLDVEIIEEVTEISFSQLVDNPWGFFIDFFHLVKPFIIGGIPLAIMAWFFFYAIMKLVLSDHLEKIAARRALKAKKKVEQENNGS